MLVVYDSKTGNVKRFAGKLKGVKVMSIDEAEELNVQEPFVLVTYTTGFGMIPPKTLKYVEKHKSNLCGVSASGNRNWGDGFAKSADKIAEMFNVDVINKFELSGSKVDVINFLEGVKSIESRLVAH